MLAMSLFIFPLTVTATQSEVTNTNVAPPTVFAEIYGTLLHIEAISGFFAVEAVFINERRFNFRVDSALIIDISNYISREQTIAVYAVDFAGNVSNTVLLTPPTLESFLPSPIELNPFTPEGQGTVLDRATDTDGKEFFTFTTPAGNVFHLIVDNHRGSNNVFFLNAVTESDLIALAEASGVDIPNHTMSGIPDPPTIEIPEEVPPEPEVVEELPSQRSDMSGGTIFFLILILFGVGGAGYYFKIYRPKQQEAIGNDEDYEDDEFIEPDENNGDDEDVEEELTEPEE